MELVLSTNGLRVGGSESYLLTVAGHLQRLGHAVTVQANEVDPAVVERHPELRVVAGDRGLPERCDAVLVQDGICAYALAERYPVAPQVFVAHSTVHDLQLPPQLPNVCEIAVALNERVAARLRALSTKPEVVRLRQPIDLDVFAPQVPLRPASPRVLALGNRLSSERLALLEAACDALGFELTSANVRTTVAHDPDRRILDSDIVVGYGRCVLEGMACGRAAYVWDHLGGDGWVTPESYPVLEADGFGGRATDLSVDGDRLRADLARYQPEMGGVNRDLAVRQHGSREHAQALVELLDRAGVPVHGETATLAELGRLTRVSWDAERRSISYARMAEGLHRELRVAEAQRARAKRLEEELGAAKAALKQERARTAGAERALGRVKATRRYRLAAAMAWPLDSARRLRGSLSRTRRKRRGVL